MRDIVTYPDPVLREKAQPVQQIDDDLRDLIEDMADVMYGDDGIGLAANQVGDLRRVIVIDAGEGFAAFINPEITSRGEETEAMEEGCLSLPGIRVHRDPSHHGNGEGHESGGRDRGGRGPGHAGPGFSARNRPFERRHDYRPRVTAAAHAAQEQAETAGKRTSLNPPIAPYSNCESFMQGMLKGIPVSEGIAIGKAWVLESPWDEVIEYPLRRGRVRREVRRYEEALAAVVQQLVECRDRVHQEIGEEEAMIFEAHLAMLNDPFFQEEISARIRDRKMNAESLLKEGVDEWVASFQQMQSEFFRFRGDDIRDVGVRILRNLLQTEETAPASDEPAILVAHSLTPSETARIHKEKILGFATELGGKTSHASILARAMGLPAVVGVERLMRKARTGETVIVDGNAGLVYVDPPDQVLEGFKKRKKQFDVYLKRLTDEASLPAVTNRRPRHRPSGQHRHHRGHRHGPALRRPGHRPVPQPSCPFSPPGGS